MPIRIAQLKLTDFRNFERLDITLGPGLTIFRGRNGHGKSNLLEGVYLLSIAKSPRASADRALVRWEVLRSGGHAQALALAVDGEVTSRVQVDFEVTPPPASASLSSDAASARGSVQKSLRVNGIPRTAAEFVGSLNVVSFAVEDIQLVAGPPSVRRRYLDIFISQGDPNYLRAIQRYQRVVTQRNHLLRLIRDGRAKLDELGFWDDRICEEGSSIIERRHRAVETLRSHAVPAHERLAGISETLGLRYVPRLGPAGPGESRAAREVSELLSRSLAAVRERELAQGVTVVGPHRDELELTLNGQNAGEYASRGQARTIALALKLAEADFVAAATGRAPVLALDDVLSELDARRRRLVLDSVTRYEQTLMTTTEFDPIDPEYLARAARFAVLSGTVQAIED